MSKGRCGTGGLHYAAVFSRSFRLPSENLQALLADPGFNAFATRGGHIFVTQGLIDRRRNESELAGVLAHEIAHVLKKDHLRAVQKNAGLALLGDFAGAAKQGGNSQAQAALLNFGRKLYASGLDQGDEFEADCLGVVIAACAGYDAYGLPSVLQLLQAQSASDGGFALLFATRPAPDARIDSLGKAMEGRFDGMASYAGRAVPERVREFGGK
jgi:predicted Zn-dependent protease